MKKSVIVNGTRRQVEFEYRVTDKLISCQVCKRYDRRWGWLQVRTSYHEAVAIIDGVEYPGVRRWHCEAAATRNNTATTVTSTVRTRR